MLAQGVKFKEGRGSSGPNGTSPVVVSASGPKVAIPASYPGYFEILSEDGRATKAIESVAELARRMPDSVLVRQVRELQYLRNLAC